MKKHRTSILYPQNLSSRIYNLGSKFKLAFFSLFLLIFAIGLLTSQLYKGLKTIYADNTVLNIGSATNVAQALGNLKIVGGLGVGSYSAPQTAGQAVFSGNVGIGTTGPTSPLNVYSTTAVPLASFISDGTSGQMTTQSYANGANNGGGLLIQFSRGTLASPLDVNVGDRLGIISYNGYAGGAFRTVASIETRVDAGTISSTSLPTYMAFQTTTNGSVNRLERMRIDENGNVGIGTTAPNYLLHLQDLTAGHVPGFQILDSYSTGLTNAKGYTQAVYQGDVYFNNREAYSDIFATSNTERMRITSGGNVGIGTASPKGRLNTLALANVANMTLGSATEPGLSVTSSDGGQYGMYFGVYGNGNSWIQAGRTDSATAYNMSLQASGGNVGIGTVSPGYKLDVNGNQQVTDVYNNGWFRNQNSLQGLYNSVNGNHIYSESGNYWTMTSAGSTTGGLIFRDQQQSTLRGYVYHDTSGFGLLQNNGGWAIRFPYNSYDAYFNGSLNTPNGGQLNAGGGTWNYGAVTIAGSKNGWEGINFRTSSGGSNAGTLMIYWDGSTSYEGYYHPNDAQWLWRFDNGVLTINSDRRLKKNIEYLTDTEQSLGKILQLTPAKFDRINGGTNNLGFIAQDVQKVIPEAVANDPLTPYLSLKTDYLIPHMVNAIKQEQKEISSHDDKLKELTDKTDKQQATIDSQQKQIDSLKATIEELKK